MFLEFFCWDIIGLVFKHIRYESEKNEMSFKDTYFIVVEV